MDKTRGEAGQPQPRPPGEQLLLPPPARGLPEVVTASSQDYLVCMEGLPVDGEHNIQQLALGTEGSQTLQEAGTVAGC